MKISFANAGAVQKGVAVVFALADCVLSESAAALNKKSGGALLQAAKIEGFEGKAGQALNLVAPAQSGLERVLVVGLGKADGITRKSLNNAGGKIRALLARAAEGAAVNVDAIDGCDISPADMAAELAFGATLRAYSFDKYKSKNKDDKKPHLKSLTLRAAGAAKAKRAFAGLQAVADGVFFTRDLVSEPANLLYPAEFAARTKRELTKLGVKVTVLGEKEMKKLGMGALLGVGQGSVRESKMVIMEWNGLAPSKKKASKPLAIIGKGVCFDTGGISLKPAGGMEDMKWDMGGAGVVAGLMKSLAGRKAKVHVVGAIGLVENMPDGNAQRPGDIVTSMAGKTIEVLNTDAEGRLVLADVLHYVNTKHKPKFMVDLATLTGAMIIALGGERAGVFSNNDELADNLFDSGEAVDERLWRFPLGDEYDRMLDCDIADMKNISGGRGAGSITAAQFLQRFVGDTPWAHLDIAGVTWSKKDAAVVPKGGTGFGVRLLDRMIAEHYE